jgi:hypothetical protein
MTLVPKFRAHPCRKSLLEVVVVSLATSSSFKLQCESARRVCIAYVCKCHLLGGHIASARSDPPAAAPLAAAAAATVAAAAAVFLQAPHQQASSTMQHQAARAAAAKRKRKTGTPHLPNSHANRTAKTVQQQTKAKRGRQGVTNTAVQKQRVCWIWKGMSHQQQQYSSR